MFKTLISNSSIPSIRLASIHTRWYLILTLLLYVVFLQAQVTGTVFRDFNGDGVKDTYEPTVAGVTINVYTSTGATCGTAVSGSGAAPNYTVPGCSGAVRVEFVIPVTASTVLGVKAGVDFTSYSGNSYGSSVQFVTAPATSVNFALNYPGDYWDNTTNPKLLISRFVNGDGVNNPYPNETSIIQIGNEQSGLTPVTHNVASWSETGAVWGEGYQKGKDRFFLTAMGKRHAGFGLKGPGGVYVAENVGGNYDLTASFSLEGVTPAIGSPITFGSITRVTSPTTADNFISNATAQPGGGPNRDLDAYSKVGKVSFGDAEIYHEGNKLFMVNLFQRSIISLDATVPTSTLNNASVATLGPLTQSYSIASLPGVPTCTNGILRPWAIKFYRGQGYLGVVCDGSISQNNADLAGYILKFDPNNIAAGFTTVLTLNFGYRSNVAIDWNAWTDNWGQTGLGAIQGPVYAEPIIGQIEFDENGGIILVINNRFGHLTGSGNYPPISGNTTIVWGQSYGDILYACYDKTAGVWAMEETVPGCQVTTTYGYADEGYGDGYGGVAREFFNDHAGDGASENGMGGAAKLMGSNQLIATVVDPYPPGAASDPIYASTGGLHWYDNTSGDWTQYARLYTSIDPGTFAKASGLGDIEAVLPPAPIEIGNRVWIDTDKDGVQDSDEAPIPNVTLELYADFDNNGVPDGVALASVTTNAQGTWYFNAANVTDGDPTVAGNQTGIQPNKNYLIRVASSDWSGGVGVGDLAGYTLTSTDTGGAGQPDVRDNDAALMATIPAIIYTTGNYGENNHTLDIGFYLFCNITAIAFTNQSVCNGNNTNNSGADDWFTADITVTFSSPPTTGTLNITGDVLPGGGVTSVSVATAGSGPTYTFVGVRLKADGTMSDITASFSDDAACMFTTMAGPSVAPCPKPCMSIDCIETGVMKN